ncbi:Uu.00g132590.m01.CDS01 [Anthostomella pinea]|uniref:Neutral protease 2 n=1 Tax=Anthostomella pinea TaxID=933095 RepID=A0AAI8YI98_9PEZI|nr:Uu.00g132590.m01.CDS01 [Anthostomella pinea]
MKFLGSVTLLASLASAASMKRASPLNVQLEMVGNSAVKASVTNTGADALKVLKTGTILDKAPVEKVQVFQGSEQVGFEGIRLRLTTTGLEEESFQSIAAGETVEVNFDAAELHDLSSGGDFDFVANGALSYAQADSTEIAGAVPFSSNTVTAKVDGAQAQTARAAFINKRTAVSMCSGTQLTRTTTAVSNCRAFAARASAAALSNTAKVNEYFKSTSVGSQVAAVFARVITECGTTTGGVSDTYCEDVYGACSSNVLAYTLPSQSYIVNCPIYFSALSPITSTCHGQDQATTTLHEVTHLSQIAGTDDLGYGYAAATALSSRNALNNADSYALFANAIYVGC